MSRNAFRLTSPDRWSERQHLPPLPAHSCADYELLSVRVTCHSTITVRCVLYTVPSQLIGQRLTIHLYHDPRPSLNAFKLESGGAFRTIWWVLSVLKRSYNSPESMLTLTAINDALAASITVMSSRVYGANRELSLAIAGGRSCSQTNLIVVYGETYKSSFLPTRLVA